MNDEVLFNEVKHLGIITLNKPSALNALSLTMICAIKVQLECWQKDSTVKAVVIRAMPGKAFCAGGDVRHLYEARLAQDAQQMQFFQEEYELNHLIGHLGKPYIALMDGITMGGGAGVSLHGSHPVASERFIFAMPETSIGFFPDVGASFFLTRCRDFLGVYLGLTGARLKAGEALDAGLVKYVVPSARMDDLIESLSLKDWSGNGAAVVDACIRVFHEPPDLSECHGASTLLNNKISACFCYETVEEITGALLDMGDDWALKTYELLLQKAPLSLKVTLAQLQKAKGLPLEECLRMDFILANHFMKSHDFYEGVRALLVNKDKNPHWQPKALEYVSKDLVASYFHNHYPEILALN